MESNDNTSRKEFLKSIGLLTLTTALASVVNPLEAASETIVNTRKKEELDNFLTVYEKWVDEFNKMVDIQKKDRHHFENNKRMMELSEEAAAFLPKVKECYASSLHRNRYLILSQRLTNNIDHFNI